MFDSNKQCISTCLIVTGVAWLSFNVGFTVSNHIKVVVESHQQVQQVIAERSGR